MQTKFEVTRQFSHMLRLQISVRLLPAGQLFLSHANLRIRKSTPTNPCAAMGRAVRPHDEVLS